METEPKIPEFNIEDFDEKFESTLPHGWFETGCTWTKQGSSEGLAELAGEAMKNALEGERAVGVVKFVKLPDGGYEVKSYKSKE